MYIYSNRLWHLWCANPNATEAELPETHLATEHITLVTETGLSLLDIVGVDH